MYGINTHINTTALSLATFFDTIDRTFFTPKFGTYEHLTFFNNPTMFKILVLGIYIGVLVASVSMFYNKRVPGGFVRKLDSEKAYSPESAKTLDELGFLKNPFIRASLKSGYSLRRVISYVPVKRSEDDSRKGGNLIEAAYAREKLDLKEDKFYLPEEKRDLTIQRFRTKGSGILSVILVAVLGIIAVVLIFKIAPVIVNLLEAVAAGFSNEPDVLT